MSEKNEEGIVLKAVPCQDHHHVVTIFSEKSGLLRLFVNGYVRKSTHALVTPLAKVSFNYVARGEGLPKLKEGKVLDHHLGLRKCLDRLEAGCEMAQGLLATQMVGNPAPGLYRLFSSYLSELSREPSPALVSSFLLKVLKHEGLLKVEEGILEQMAHSRSFREIRACEVSPELGKRVQELFEEMVQ